MDKNLRQLFTFIFTLFVAVSTAQISTQNEKIALDLVKQHRTDIGLSMFDIVNTKVNASYTDNVSGAQLVYLQQTYKGVAVYNQLQVLAFKNNQLASKQGNRINVEKLTKYANEIPTLSAEIALTYALANKNITAPKSLILATPIPNNYNKYTYGKLGISNTDITAELLWIPNDDATTVQLGWQINVAPTLQSDNWLIRVNASTGAIIGATNLTVYCNWDGEKNTATHQQTHQHITNVEADNTPQIINTPTNNKQPNSPNLVGTANYLVIPYPLEAPSFGAAAIRTNPWAMSPGNATTLGWHNDGTIDYTITRGNNVWSKEDRLGNNSTAGLPATSTTSPDPLNFNFTPDFATQPITGNNQPFAITNLFYLNNIIHDITYNYGFTEAAANFQKDNLGRGGLGNDFVFADAQDGSGSNNANFSTPADGSNGRMQMFLFGGSPQIDGDLDAGVVYHEYGHGITHRLTGGPNGGAGCMGNKERGDEGWSDYYGLMLTTNWATALISDGFTKPRGIGTYVQGQGPTGSGIRNYLYCTNLAVNPLTYANMSGTSSGGQVHNIGEIWCSTIWDMTWNIIQTTGINPNLFNAAGTGGNTIALKLVILGEKLQKCSPGFLDSRDGILAADQILYNGAYHCQIVAAFARRGMGFDALQGLSSSTSDHTPGFSQEESNMQLTQTVTQQSEGANITYTNTVKAFCVALNNYTLTDTLPLNVTYVSGGTYNASNRVVSFPVNLAIGASQNYSFTVTVNSGSYFTPINVFEDVVATNTIPSTWTRTTTTTANWASSTARFHTAPYSYYSTNLNIPSDQQLFSTTAIALGATPPDLTFWHYYATESTYDGGILEISTDNGSTYSQVPNAAFTTGGYTGTMDASTILAGKQAWTGSNGAFTKVTLPLTAYANQNIKIKFRSTTDDGTNAEGWYVDDIAIKKTAIVEIKSNLFNGTNKLVQVADTFTVITPNPNCQTLAAQPTNKVACSNTATSFAVNVVGTGVITYQWQESINATAAFTNITNGGVYSGATTNTLMLSNIPVGLNNYRYRCVATGGCPALSSNPATLTVNTQITVATVPANVTICSTGNTSFAVTATGTAPTYQWQVNNGTGFVNITGATLSTLALNSVTTSMNGNQYRCVVSGAAPCSSINSAVATLSVSAQPTISLTASPYYTLFPGLSTTLTANSSITGTNVTYNWFYNSNAFTNNTNTYLVNINKIGTYKVNVVDNVNGCTNTSADVVIKDSASTKLFIYPTPNDGRFTVAYYNSSATVTKQSIVIYDAKGFTVFNQTFVVNQTYQLHAIDLRRNRGGVYYVALFDINGKRLATGHVSIIK